MHYKLLTFFLICTFLNSSYTKKLERATFLTAHLTSKAVERRAGGHKVLPRPGREWVRYSVPYWGFRGPTLDQGPAIFPDRTIHDIQGYFIL